MAAILGKLRRGSKQKSVVDNSSAQTCNLVYSLESLLSDSGALQYFIQYLDSCGKIALIQFWMRVQGFRSSASSDISQLTAIQDDANAIYSSFISDDAPYPINLPPKLKEIIHNRIHSNVSSECFADAQYFVRQLFELRYFEEFKSSIYFKKHELEVLNAGCSLYDVIHIQALLQSLIEVLDEGEDRAMLQFLIAADSYETEYYFVASEQAQSDAMVIYDTYFSMQARCPLNISPAERTAIELSICGESGEPDRMAFAKQKQHFCTLLTNKYLSTFLASQCVTDYVLDVKSQIEKWVVDIPPRGRIISRTSSCSSVHSDASESKKLLNGLGKTKKTYLAEIDCMGRYRPLFEGGVVQGTSSPHRLKLRLRRYLNSNSLRDDEIAEEVARSIIDDVQKMVEQGRRAGNGC